MDVLRAVAEALIDAEPEAAGTDRDDPSVHAVAAERREFDAQ